MTDKRPNTPPNISFVFAQHFRSLQGVRDSFFACHAGLLELKETHFKSFDAGMPPFFKAASSITKFEDIRYRAQVSLLRTALNELRRLNVSLLEQSRRFLEMQKIAVSNSSNVEKTSQMRSAIESAPKGLNELIESVAQLLPGGFRSAEELKSLVMLERLLAMSSRPPTADTSAKPPKARLRFVRPDITKSPTDGTKSALKLVPVGLEIEPGSKMSIDANFVRLVFFTAYTIGLNLSQKLKAIKATSTVTK
jgi:hypothetical protein